MVVDGAQYVGVEFEIKTAAAAALLMLTKSDKKDKNCIKIKVVQSVEPNSVRVQTVGGALYLYVLTERRG